jgi:PBSX family phage terminase large subunit
MTVVTHEYAPRGAARTLRTARDPEVLLSGPAGTGKSRACLEKLNMLALLNPGMRGIIVRKTLVSLASTALDTWRKAVMPEALATGEVRFYGGSQEEPAQYLYRNGSVIAIGGMDKPSKIMSSEWDVIYVQEATELEVADWEALTSRLRNWRISFQQIIADCNPSFPTHWLKQRCDRGVCKMMYSKHEDNPMLFDEQGVITERGKSYMAKLDALTGVRKERLRFGRWVAAEGIIYEGFDPDVHVIPAFEIPWGWPRYWAIDFGFTNPFVLQWWAEDPDGRLFMYREIYRTQRLVEDHARHALSIVRAHYNNDEYGKWLEPQPVSVICDHDAEDRATFERHSGMTTRPAHKSVSDGIQAFQTRLRPASDGRPRLFLFENALVERDAELDAALKPCCTVEEFPGYIWDVRDGKPPKETPVKKDDHGLDTGRYVVADRDLSPKFNVRFI